MHLTFRDLPAWEFDIREVSAGVYKVVGIGPEGRKVEVSGEDPNALLEQCRADIEAWRRTSGKQ